MNKRVMVIGQNEEYGAQNVLFPPIGAVGTTISFMDDEGDYDVMFDEYPCPTYLPDASWVTHRSLIVFLGTAENTTVRKIAVEA